jgi:hypothetical protein
MANKRGGIQNYSVLEGNNIALGQAGSILVKSTTAATALNGVFVAIQFVTDTTFDSTDGLVAETTELFPDDGGTSTSVSTLGGGVTDSVVFPAGLTIYGRWTSFKLTSGGTVIAYLG